MGKNSIKNGIRKSWYENGQLQKEENYNER